MRGPRLSVRRTFQLPRVFDNIVTALLPASEQTLLDPAGGGVLVELITDCDESQQA